MTPPSEADGPTSVTIPADLETPGPVSLTEVLEFVRGDYVANLASWSRPGFRAMAVQRLGAYGLTLQNRVLRRAVRAIHRVGHRYVRNHYGIEIHATTRVGRRCFLAHQSGIVIHEFAHIGDDCKIRQGVTIGQLSSKSIREGAPVIGNRVEIGAGAVIVGPVRIGDDVTIGPNSVVVRDIPSGASAMGPPAKIIASPTGGEEPRAGGAPISG